MSQPDSIRSRYEEAGQGQVFAFADELSPDQLADLEKQAAGIDLGEVRHLVDTLVKNPTGGNENLAGELEPARYEPLPTKGGDPGLWQRARTAGEETLSAGRVAAFVVAGGQGTRLGYDGPKGTFPVTPVLGKSLFQVFAEKIGTASKRYGHAIPWYVMTSVINHGETVRFFEEHDHFGLEEGQVRFFSQGLMPAVDDEGKILLADKGRIALSPDGHGGSLRALHRSGAVAEMEAAGIDAISYFQVDNPLVRVIDPEFIGFHLLRESQLSSKALPKAYPEEKVGVFCERDGQNVVIEYSDLPRRLAEERDAEGELRFRAGSIAIHVFDRDFVKRLGSGEDENIRLPFHRARKKVSCLGADGSPVEPEEPNAYKFEMFVFDALPFASDPVIIETAREDDFSPVKNAEGVDSPRSSREDQLRQFARWFRAAGVELETDGTGLPGIAVEISPTFADSEEAFVEAWRALADPPPVVDGLVLA